MLHANIVTKIIHVRLSFDLSRHNLEGKGKKKKNEHKRCKQTAFQRMRLNVFIRMHTYYVKQETDDEKNKITRQYKYLYIHQIEC
jgi:hypothetical protein